MLQDIYTIIKNRNNPYPTKVIVKSHKKIWYIVQDFIAITFLLATLFMLGIVFMLIDFKLLS